MERRDGLGVKKARVGEGEKNVENVVVFAESWYICSVQQEWIVALIVDNQ